MDNNFQEKPATSQALKDQNIFFLLGVLEASEAEKDDFLERLQKSIWDDFLDNDVELLLTEDEVSALAQIINKQELSEAEKEKEIVDYLEEIVPDLEDILMEKALKLKEDLTVERIISMEQLVANDQDKLNELRTIRELVAESKWRDAGDKLNALSLS